MCLGCMVHEDFYGECLPGIYLMRATKTDSDVEPEMLAGQWGLTITNGPFVIWDALIEDPFNGMTDEEIDASDADMEPYFNGLADFRDGLYCYPYHGYKLVTAAIQKGYNEEKNGEFGSWLYDYLGQYIKTCKVDRWADKYPTGSWSSET